MDPVVTVAQGRLRGREKDGVNSFLGIPYAQPPFGALRFAAPVPAVSWAGTRDAVEFGATVPKPGYLPPMDAILPDPYVPGSDCLNLNVWAPDQATDLPVYVWIHGGAFVNGSGAVPVYDGTAFARDGVVCVTVNYRMGMDGFGLIAGTVPNRGMLDQVAALTWVRDNIAAFGGDPDRITVAGESAGAFSVATLLAMPLAAGLFGRVILQSGAGQHVLTPATAAKVTAEVAARLGVEPTVNGLGAVAVADLIRAQQAVSIDIAAAPDPVRWAEITTNMMAFEPIVDGDILPVRPIDAIAAGASAGIDMLIGTTTEEFALFLVPTGISAAVGAAGLRATLALYGADVDQVIAAYQQDRPDATPGEIMIAVLTDWFFRIPAIRVAEARGALGADTYVYEFGWRSPQFGGHLGACHALEIAFAFDNLGQASTGLAGPNPPQSLADEMHLAWVSFVRDGSPGWPAYGAGRTVMRFDETSGRVHDPRAHERELWTGVR